MTIRTWCQHEAGSQDGHTRMKGAVGEALVKDGKPLGRIGGSRTIRPLKRLLTDETRSPLEAVRRRSNTSG
jgi:hypothetical protein